MTCPRCALPDVTTEACPRCGVILAKAEERRARARAEPPLVVLEDAKESRSHRPLILAAAVTTGWAVLVSAAPVLLAVAGVLLVSPNPTDTEAVLRTGFAAWLLAHGVPLRTELGPIGLVPLFVLVTTVSLAFSYYLIEPRIERRFNRLGHTLASADRTPKAIVTAS